jgi:hypothetical protein
MERDFPEALVSGPAYRFLDWLNDAVPRSAAGTYTIWNGDQFLYVGMSGSKLDVNKRSGLSQRLAAHFSGRRSGDQFCVYVADRLILRLLSHTHLEEISQGRASLDRFVRDYVRANLTYRYVVAPDVAVAMNGSGF